MDFQELYTRLHDLNNDKCDHLKGKDENDIDYTILSEEIEDIAHALKTLAKHNIVERNSSLHGLAYTTTSGRLSRLLYKFLKEDK